MDFFNYLLGLRIKMYVAFVIWFKFQAKNSFKKLVFVVIFSHISGSLVCGSLMLVKVMVHILLHKIPSLFWNVEVWFLWFFNGFFLSFWLGLAPEIPEDLYHLIKKAVSIRKHLERNRKDKDSKFRLILVESRIHRLARYYKKTKKLPPVWK